MCGILMEVGSAETLPSFVASSKTLLTSAIFSTGDPLAEIIMSQRLLTVMLFPGRLSLLY